MFKQNKRSKYQLLQPNKASRYKLGPNGRRIKEETQAAVEEQVISEAQVPLSSINIPSIISIDTREFSTLAPINRFRSPSLFEISYCSILQPPLIYPFLPSFFKNNPSLSVDIENLQTNSKSRLTHISRPASKYHSKQKASLISTLLMRDIFSRCNIGLPQYKLFFLEIPMGQSCNWC